MSLNFELQYRFWNPIDSLEGLAFIFETGKFFFLNKIQPEKCKWRGHGKKKEKKSKIRFHFLRGPCGKKKGRGLWLVIERSGSPNKKNAVRFHFRRAQKGGAAAAAVGVAETGVGPLHAARSNGPRPQCRIDVRRSVKRHRRRPEWAFLSDDAPPPSNDDSSFAQNRKIHPSSALALRRTRPHTTPASLTIELRRHPNSPFQSQVQQLELELLFSFSQGPDLKKPSLLVVVRWTLSMMWRGKKTLIFLFPWVIFIIECGHSATFKLRCTFSNDWWKKKDYHFSWRDFSSSWHCGNWISTEFHWLISHFL